MIYRVRTIGIRSLFPIYKIYQPPAKPQITQPDLFKQYKAGLIKRPLTFDDKCIIINDPKMIAHIELVEYGITFKPTQKLLILALLLGGLFMTYLYKTTPHSISQRYFSISQQSNQYKFSYFGALFSFDSLGKIILYIPAFVSVLTGSRYLRPVDFVVLIGLGAIGNYLIGNRAISEKINSLEVWDRYKIPTGEYFIISIITSFLAMKTISPFDLFNNLRLRLFFDSKVGIGIVSAGIPIILPLLFYCAYELYSCHRKGQSKELLLYYVLTGALYGLFRRLSIFKTI